MFFGAITIANINGEHAVFDGFAGWQPHDEYFTIPFHYTTSSIGKMHDDILCFLFQENRVNKTGLDNVLVSNAVQHVVRGWSPGRMSCAVDMGSIYML